MLDIRSKIVLRYLIKQCYEGSYKIIEIDDIISCLPQKYGADRESVKQIVNHLASTDYISVKYSDEDVYCLSALPFGRQYVESEDEQEKKSKKLKSVARGAYIALFFIALLGAFLGTLIYNILF